MGSQMKNRYIGGPGKILLRLAVLMGIALIISQNSMPAAAQTGGGYSLTWNVIANGGSTTSVGGSYALDGTIGQAGAGAPSGGVYTLAGGFWTSVPNAVSNSLKMFMPMIETSP